MPGHIDLKSATAELRALVERVRGGEEIVFTQDGAKIAKLAPVSSVAEPTKELPFGIWRERIRLSPDFDAPLSEDELDEFEQWPKPGMP